MSSRISGSGSRPGSDESNCCARVERVWGRNDSLSRQAKAKLTDIESEYDADAVDARVNREVSLKKLITEILSGREAAFAAYDADENSWIDENDAACAGFTGNDPPAQPGGVSHLI